MGDAVLALIDRAEYLAPFEQEKLIDVASATVDPMIRGRCLEKFARKIHVFASEDSRERIVDAVLKETQTDGRGYRLGLLAENLKRISVLDREKTATAILELDKSGAGRLWALSKLTKNLDALGPQTIPKITYAATEELRAPSVEDFEGEDTPWYTEPSTCRVEMAHHLSMRPGLLTRDEAESVTSFVNGVLMSRANYRAKAQLLSHMKVEERRRFVETWLPDDADPVVQDDDKEKRAQQVVEGMTLRIEDLNRDEKQTCTQYLASVLSAECAENALQYTISNNLSRFDQRAGNHLATQATSHCQYWDLDSSVGVFEHIARQAGQFDSSTILHVLGTTQKIAKEVIRDADTSEESCLRSLAVFAAQSAANWSRSTLVAGTVDLEDHVLGEGAHTRRNYDNRPVGRGL
jgi:hypothetical protein